MTNNSNAIEVVAVTSPAPVDAWSRIAEQDPTCLVTQSVEWTQGVVRSGAYSDASRYYRYSNGDEAVLPLVCPTGLRRFASSGSMPASYGFGGIVASAPQTSHHTGGVWADLVANPPMRLRIRPNPEHDRLWASTAPSNVRAEPRRAHVLDLSGGYETVWNDRFASGTRRGVRKAEKSDLEVICGTDARPLKAFYDLFLLSVRRWADKQREPHWLALQRAKRRDPLSKFEQLVASCGKAFTLWVAWRGDAPAAAVVVLQGTNAHYTRGAMDQELAGRDRANDLLHAAAIRAACDAGSQRYHMGETGDSETLARFKKRFGAQPVEYHEYFLERLPVRQLDQGARSVVKRAIGFRDV